MTLLALYALAFYLHFGCWTSLPNYDVLIMLYFSAQCFCSGRGWRAVVSGNRLLCCCSLRGAGGSEAVPPLLGGSGLGTPWDQPHAPALPVCSPPPTPGSPEGTRAGKGPARGRAGCSMEKPQLVTSAVVEKGSGVCLRRNRGDDFSHVVLQYGFKTEASFKRLI